MAILCGGDYNPVSYLIFFFWISLNGIISQGGLSGCGWKTALQLSRTNLARDLFFATQTITTHQQMQDFLIGWRQDFRTLLAENPDDILDRQYPSIAKNVASNFPEIETLSLYAHPVTSFTMNNIPDIASWCLRPPDLVKIAFACEKYFSWGSLGEIIPRFKATLWPGVVFRYLLLVSLKTMYFSCCVIFNTICLAPGYRNTIYT